MVNSIESFLEGLKIHNDLIVDVNGTSYKAQDYLKHYYRGMKAQYDKNVLPQKYEYPTGIQFELTYKCNQKCVHCYNQSGEANNNNDTGMSIEEWKEIAHQVGKLGVFQCVISGGEPTILGDGLFEIMDILHSYKIKFILITNGMLIDDEKVKRLKKYKYNWLQVSIDGSRPELHNYVRGVDSWEKAVRAADLVKRAGIPLVVAHAVVKKNIDYLEEMIDMAYIMGVHKIVTGPFSYMGRAILNNDQLSLSEDDVQRIYKVANKKAHEYRGRMEVAVSAEEVVSLRVRLIEPNGVLLLRPNGDVKFDCVAPFKIGNVREESIKSLWDKLGKDVWTHPRMSEYVSSIKSSNDLLNVTPRINVDPDELLIPIENKEVG